MDDFDRRMKLIQNVLQADIQGETPRPVSSTRTLFGIKSSVEEQIEQIVAEREEKIRKEKSLNE
jgi:hypothetical protein